MNRLILLLFLLMPTCARPMPVVDSRLQPYYNEVVDKIFNRCSYYEVNWPYFRTSTITTHERLKDIPNAIGMCVYTNNKWDIFILDTFWADTTENKKYELIAHELSHCVLGTQHINQYGHYMHESTQNITKKEVMKQLDDVLAKRCFSKP